MGCLPLERGKGGRRREGAERGWWRVGGLSAEESWGDLRVAFQGRGYIVTGGGGNPVPPPRLEPLPTSSLPSGWPPSPQTSPPFPPPPFPLCSCSLPTWMSEMHTRDLFPFSHCTRKVLTLVLRLLQDNKTHVAILLCFCCPTLIATLTCPVPCQPTCLESCSGASWTCSRRCS